VIRTPVKAPNANAHAERWVRTIREECLDWLLIVGRRQLERGLRTYVDHYTGQRPHPSARARSSTPAGRADSRHGREPGGPTPKGSARRAAARV
jgi:putative transposase